MNLMEITKITSAQNATIKQFNHFNRRKTPNLILLDGPHLNLEYFKASQKCPTQTIVTKRFMDNIEFEPFKNWPNLIEVPDSLMAKISPTKSPAGILSLAEKPNPLKARKTDLVIILENLQDPGNLGTMLRTSLAMGVDQVLCFGQTTDLWSPKALRAGMGAQFYVPTDTLNDIEAWAESFTGSVMATSLQGENLWQQPLPEKVAFVFGNEGQGVTPETLALCKSHIKIPMHANAESLNVASALAILTHEWARQNQAF